MILVTGLASLPATGQVAVKEPRSRDVLWLEIQDSLFEYSTVSRIHVCREDTYLFPEQCLSSKAFRTLLSQARELMDGIEGIEGTANEDDVLLRMRNAISEIHDAYSQLLAKLPERASRDLELDRPPRSLDDLVELFRSEYYSSRISDHELLSIYESAYIEQKRQRDLRAVYLDVSKMAVVALFTVIALMMWLARFLPPGTEFKIPFTRLSMMLGRGGKPQENLESEKKSPYEHRVIHIGKKALIKEIRLHRIRGFENFHLGFLNPSGNLRSATLIIGKNGTNKTTLLRCIALGLADQADSASLLSKPIGALVSEGAGYGEIEIVLQGEDGSIHEIRRKIFSSKAKEYIESDPPDAPSYDLFVCGYGAGRIGAGIDPGRQYRILDSVLNLFDYSTSLIDTELTLRRLQDTLSKSRYEAIKNGLKRILNLSEEDDLRPAKGGGVEVLEKSIGEWVRLEAWADGYRLTLSWLLDLYGWAMRSEHVDRKGKAYGIVLVDELDQHLHPSMQAQVIGDLKDIFPGIQWVFTTHSPLAALGSSPEELVVLRRENGRVEQVAKIPDFSLFSAEDMMRDEALFDTEVYAPEANQMLEEYHRLVKIPPERLETDERRKLKEYADKLVSRQMIPPRRDESEDEEIMAILSELQASRE